MLLALGMWLLMLAFTATIATAIWYAKAEKDVYMLKLLSAILWGATVMALTDRILSYAMEGGEFIEMSLEAVVLGFVLITAALVLWEIILLIKDPKGIFRKRVQPLEIKQ